MVRFSETDRSHQSSKTEGRDGKEQRGRSPKMGPITAGDALFRAAAIGRPVDTKPRVEIEASLRAREPRSPIKARVECLPRS